LALADVREFGRSLDRAAHGASHEDVDAGRSVAEAELPLRLIP
jgi:hypothetical protein